MPVRQATSTVVRDKAEDRAAEEPKKPKRNGLRGKGRAPSVSESPLSESTDFPALVQALLDLSSSSDSITPHAVATPSLTPLSASATPTLVEAISPDESIQLHPSSVAEIDSDEVEVDDLASQASVGMRENRNGAVGGDIDYHHDSEAEFGRLLGYYGIEWQYEPHQFPLQWRDGRPIVMFTPDFYLPEYDLYIELTTMRQSLVRRKNRKLRLLRALYPEINIKLLYRRDYHRLLTRFGIVPEELDAEAIEMKSPTSEQPGATSL